MPSLFSYNDKSFEQKFKTTRCQWCKCHSFLPSNAPKPQMQLQPTRWKTVVTVHIVHGSWSHQKCEILVVRKENPAGSTESCQSGPKSISLFSFLSFFFFFSPEEWQSHTEAWNKKTPNDILKQKKNASSSNQQKKRENIQYEHLTAYLSISTARELSLTLISVAGWGGGVWCTHTVSVLSMLDSPSSLPYLFSCLPTSLCPIYSNSPLPSSSLSFSPAPVAGLSVWALLSPLSYKHILLY